MLKEEYKRKVLLLKREPVVIHIRLSDIYVRIRKVVSEVPTGVSKIIKAVLKLKKIFSGRHF